MKENSVINWVARIAGLVSIAVVLLFYYTQRDSFSTVTTSDTILFLFFPIGLIVGLFYGLNKKLAGGLIAIGSLAGFYLAHLIISGSFPSGWAFILFALPGLIYLIAWALELQKTKNPIN